jgi:hypothetical protein
VVPVSVRAGMACLVAAALVVALGAWVGLQLGRVSTALPPTVAWTVAGVGGATALSLMPFHGWQRAWLPPLALLAALSELLPRSGISAPLLAFSLVSFAVVAWARRPERHAVRAVAILACGACLAAALVSSQG